MSTRDRTPLEVDIACVVAPIVSGRGSVCSHKRAWVFKGFGAPRTIDAYADVATVRRALFPTTEDGSPPDLPLSPIRDILHCVRMIFDVDDVDEFGARWRFAARVIEAAQPYAEQISDLSERHYLPIFHWVRWRILSEPFRTEPIRTKQLDDWGTETFDGGSDREELRLRAFEARDMWAETLLMSDDLPILRRSELNLESEARLLVFHDQEDSQLLFLASSQGPSDQAKNSGPGSDDTFITWFTREFFSRRFMITDMWRAVRSRWKWVAATGLITTAAVALCGAFWPEAKVPFWLVSLGLVTLAATAVAILGGLYGESDGERFTYPFLLRFGAGTIIGSAAIVAMSGEWITKLDQAGGESRWVLWFVVGGLIAVGVSYLFVEARLHGTPRNSAIRRALGVWLIGLCWAMMVSAIVILVIAPIFAEDFPDLLSSRARVWAFMLTALASLNLGILLQVLWEDRPVTYPLGALRFSRRR